MAQVREQSEIPRYAHSHGTNQTLGLAVFTFVLVDMACNFICVCVLLLLPIVFEKNWW